MFCKLSPYDWSMVSRDKTPVPVMICTHKRLFIMTPKFFAKSQVGGRNHDKLSSFMVDEWGNYNLVEGIINLALEEVLCSTR